MGVLHLPCGPRAGPGETGLVSEPGHGPEARGSGDLPGSGPLPSRRFPTRAILIPGITRVGGATGQAENTGQKRLLSDEKKT